MAKAKKDIIKYRPDEIIVNKIHVIRGHKVMLDFDIAALYDVTTSALNQAVKRNAEKFPEPFAFRLTKKEWIQMRSQIATSSSQLPDFQEKANMMSQNVTSSSKRKVSAPPYAFTEHGIAMAATVLKSEMAVKMSVTIVNTFIELRKQILDYATLAKEIKALKFHVEGHDAQLNKIYDVIEDFLDKKVEEKKWEERERIGFKTKKAS
ncbi:MAG TPA: ORF6N domain-containing protein [Chitinophagaceae bacterium]